jgi:hypothetical protein
MIGPWQGPSVQYAKEERAVIDKFGKRGKITYIDENHLYRVEIEGEGSRKVSYDDPDYSLAPAPVVAVAAAGAAAAAAAAPPAAAAGSALVLSMFNFAPPPPPPAAVDPYAGLSARVRPLAQAISGWNQQAMAGTTVALSAAEQAELRTWVEGRRTAGGQQKYVVNVGPGTGQYAGKTQFKVTGFASLGAKAATYHITLD